MWDEIEVAVEKCTENEIKKKPDPSNLGFGKYFTDHMFRMTWSREKGWHDAKICPYQNFSMDPAALVFHYAQAIFEGMKAFKNEDGQLYFFRPEKNFERMNNSAQRMCMPRFPVDQVIRALKALVYLERDWVPTEYGSALYMRPTMIAAQPALGVQPADLYYFYIILTPVGAYYKEGFNPTKIYVSDEYTRAAKGGVGNVKAAGNYAASIYMSEIAKKEGYSQVLWLDAKEHRYVEEVGTSNIFFKFKDELVTPALSGSILPGITRDSTLKLADSFGVKAVERPVSIDEVIEGAESGDLEEVFATGTAAVISPVGELFYKGKSYSVNNNKVGALSERLYTELQEIQHGEREDPFKWVMKVN
jgi:branched-chain amino acid aminotransferase